MQYFFFSKMKQAKSFKAKIHVSEHITIFFLFCAIVMRVIFILCILRSFIENIYFLSLVRCYTSFKIGEKNIKKNIF